MRIIAHALWLVYWPPSVHSLWIWLVGGGAALLWAFWERIVKFIQGLQQIRKAHHEAQEAKRKAQLAEQQLHTHLREQRIQKMVRDLEEQAPQLLRGALLSFTAPPAPSSGEDPEEVKEAWHRFLDKHPEVPSETPDRWRK